MALLPRWLTSGTPRRPPPGADEFYAGPLRGELLGADQLAERARALAATHHTVLERRRSDRHEAQLLVRLGETQPLLERVVARLTTAAASGTDVGPAGDWLLDNFHLVREQIAQVHESLPARYFRELPLLTDGPLAEYPRVYELAITLISHTEARIDLDSVDLFVGAFQETLALSLGELWAVPAMLRLGLLESVRRMALRTEIRLDEIEDADRWATRILRDADEGPLAMRGALASFVRERRELTPTFVSRLLQQLRASAGGVPPLIGIERWFAEEGLGPTEAASRAAERLALTTLMMANSITSLRSIAPLDWRSFVEGQSVVEQVLRTDPAGVYPQMTFATRDDYRHAVERIAKGCGTTERVVAEAAVAAAAGADGTSRERHVGHWLVGRGVLPMEQTLGYVAPWRLRLVRLVLRNPGESYAGLITAFGALMILTLLLIAGGGIRTQWPLVMLAALLPVLDLAIILAGRAVTFLLPPKLLPKLDYERFGVPAESRTTVVIPTLFGSVAAVEEALGNLEVQFLANRGRHLHYALLSDWTDAKVETMPTDAAIVEAAVSGVQALNARYAPSSHDAFYLFHRAREWNASQGVWMGWERKRGKLAQFNRYLRREAYHPFMMIVGDATAIRGSRYVITLDADTTLPPGEAAALIGTIAHPLNHAVYDVAQGRVVEGYGILQPRVGVALESSHHTRFAAIHSGRPGVDPYTTAVSDVYQDLYGEGSYTGKGIYDIDAFETATHGRFPENTLLSHDLIEGSYARAGLVTDVSVFDDYPARAVTFWRRKHRWIRGDWQLLRWLTARVPGPNGEEPNRLTRLARWKLLDNLRRSTLELSQLLFLLVGWIAFPDARWRWTLLGLGIVGAPWVISLVLAFLIPEGGGSRGTHYRALAEEGRLGAKQFLLTVIFLPQQGWISADAIMRTLWRLAVSNRHLLEWQSAALTEAAVSGSFIRILRAMWGATLLPIGLLWLSPSLAPLILLWVAAPWVAAYVSRPSRRRIAPLSGAGRATAIRYAHRHWEYFARYANAESAWLAPDNVQEDPELVVAMRTSPTNIGLQLLSTVSAHDLGFIALPEMVERLRRAFATLEQLERFRGHFLNWYALPSLAVLAPGYVSTVDSGNLAGDLIALRQSCLRYAERETTSAEDAAHLQTIAAQCDRFVEEMEFGFLYDTATKLLTIGYSTVTHQHDRSSYDLLASEARLASFIAIAKREVPPEHWFHLGRTMTTSGGEVALVSWSGSMFEYLMPALLMRSFSNSLLGRSCAGALARQIQYGAVRGVPWGVSESAYNLRDRHLTYQYHAFGVPDLALKRGLGGDLVVAPYASALAAMFDPEAALRNLGRLEAMGALSSYGFYDALDFTRAPGQQPFAMVRCQMAHHVGMTLVALTNVLLDQRWQRRFHRDPRVRAIALLLDERVPARLEVQKAQTVRPDERATDAPFASPVVRTYATADTARPHVALLGHEPLTVMVTHSGGGYSRYRGLSVTRWRPDGTRDDTGSYIYLKDIGTGHQWSSGHQPTATIADRYEACLATDRATLTRTDGLWETRTEIVVVPEDAAEVRRVTVTNNGPTTREVEITSYAEVVLAPRAADRVHPAFSNLFVETEWHEWCSTLTAKRRARSGEEAAVWCAHVIDVGRSRVGEVSYESDRDRFLGRGRSTREPRAIERDGPLDGRTGAVLDPILSLRTRLRLAPGASASVAFTTLVAESREQLFALADRYHTPHAARRALDLAWTSTQVELRELGVSPADAAACQELASYILFPDSVIRTPYPARARRDGWLQTLWAHGISGDSPVVLATILSAEGLPTLQQLLSAHRYWRLRGVSVDLVVVSEEPQSYLQDLRSGIASLLATTGGTAVLDASGGVHLRNRSALGPEDFDTICAVARLAISCDGRDMERVVADVAAARDARHSATITRTGPWGRSPRLSHATAPIVADRTPTVATASSLRFDNGIGGLLPSGDYQIRIAGDGRPPAPWANVIANPSAGFVVTESGGGFTWTESSYFFRLTPWFNDPVSDPVGEALYLRDEENGRFWSPTPAPVRGQGEYVVEHGAGRSIFRHVREGIDSELTLGMAADDPVKLSVLRLTNRSDRRRTLTLTSYVEWTLGVLREQTQHRVRTRFAVERGAILADNLFDPQFASRVAFSAISEPVLSHTGDRREFIGRNGSPADPASMHQALLDGRTGLGVDPCAVLRAAVTLAPGETRTIVTILGAGIDGTSAEELMDRYRTVEQAESALAKSFAAWERRLSVISVESPEPAFDAMINRWSLYQALSCRMWARSAIYQSSGAFGFRDQLQDVMAFVHAEPELARAHILRAAARQFPEGDVQHWWHPESGRGVRTRFSDDLVWLPYVVEHYVRTTGDAAILDERVPFLAMRGLAPGEHEVYDLPSTSIEEGTLYEHCLRALTRGCTAGAHGLPLIGSGDWNDGMSRVGVGGAGESIWLGWFLITTLRAFAEQAEQRGEAALVAQLRAQAESYRVSIEASGWDGAWYRRAYFDDGTPLGSAGESECQIDSIAQSWSVISGTASPERQRAAMEALEARLVDQEGRLIRLLTPPFDETTHDPGYIKGYVPGVRENGAQYTHAALWAVLAVARRGEGEKAMQWFQLLNPLTHTDSAEGVATYRVEPYVVAADVYTAEGSYGRGGWSWYTGSASWMYRVGLEELIGFEKRGETLRLLPCVPAEWPELVVTYRYRSATYRIRVARPGFIRSQGATVRMDGVLRSSDLIALVDDGMLHEVEIEPSVSA